MPPEQPQHEAPFDAGPTETAEPDDLDAALGRRAPNRWRRARGALIALALVAIVAAVVRELLALPGQPALPLVARVATSALIFSNVSYGSVTVNGVRVGNTDALPVTATLVAGTNFIKLDAPPFLPVGCEVTGLPGTPTVDPASVGRCSITFDHAGTTLAHAVINVLLTGTDLPPDALASAERVVSGDLARVTLGSAMVPVGEYYATGAAGSGAISSRRATQPLRATPTVILAPDSDDVFPSAVPTLDALSGGDPRITLDRCADFGCELPVDVGYTVPLHGWTIGAALALDWRFTTATGALAGEARYGLGTMAVPLIAGADGASWTLAVDVQSPSGPFASSLDQCMVGAAVGMQLLTQALGQGQTKMAEQVHGQGATGPEGCEIVGEAPALLTRPAIYVWRFGVLLAANGPAHQLLPDLPLAPVDEQRAVGF